jgi:MFS family permease
MDGEAQARGSTRELLRQRPFRVLLAGQTLTLLGDLALILVLGIWAKDLTGSVSAGGAVFFALIAPMLVSPLLGCVIDYFPRRTVLIVNDLLTAAALLPLLAVHGRGDVWIIYAVAIFYGVSQQVFFAARTGLLQSMLQDEHLGSANAVLESLRMGLRTAGPVLGTAVFAALGGGAVAVLDAATFLASAALLSRLRVPDLARRRGTAVLAEMGGGIRHIRETPVLRRLLVALCAAVAVLGLLQVVGLALVDHGLHRPATFLGVIFAVEGAGAIVGGLVSPTLLRRLGEERLAGGGLVTAGLSLGVMADPELVPVLVGSAVGGAGFAAFLIGYTTLLQRSTGAELQGRVFTAAEAAAGIPYTATLGLAVLGIGFVDYRLLLMASMVVLAAAGVYLARGCRPATIAPPALRPERGAARASRPAADVGPA